MFQKLGNAYYFNAELEQSAKWYELFAMTSDIECLLHRYTQSLRAIGENDKTNEMLKKFHQLSGDDSGDLFLKM
jgi:hypothetical protein